MCSTISWSCSGSHCPSCWKPHLCASPAFTEVLLPPLQTKEELRIQDGTNLPLCAHSQLQECSDSRQLWPHVISWPWAVAAAPSQMEALRTGRSHFLCLWFPCMLWPILFITLPHTLPSAFFSTSLFCVLYFIFPLYWADNLQDANRAAWLSHGGTDKGRVIHTDHTSTHTVIALFTLTNSRFIQYRLTKTVHAHR